MIQVVREAGETNSPNGNRPKPSAARIMPTIILRRDPQWSPTRPAGKLNRANDSAPAALIWPINCGV